VFTAAVEGHVDILKLLLSWGGNVNACVLNLTTGRCDRETSLWDACGSGFEETVRVLLSRGADPNALSPAMSIPPGLMESIMTTQQSYQIPGKAYDRVPASWWDYLVAQAWM
jgi:ankyrin repeat protein